MLSLSRCLPTDQLGRGEYGRLTRGLFVYLTSPVRRKIKILTRTRPTWTRNLGKSDRSPS